MSVTLTLYRPIGTAEAELIAQNDWRSFPQMPEGFGFYAYSMPVDDPREWPKQLIDNDFPECVEDGQDEVVRSWKAWGNATDQYFVVWFEVDERLRPDLHLPLDIDAVNRALVGKIEVCARYGPSETWVHPRLRPWG